MTVIVGNSSRFWRQEPVSGGFVCSVILRSSAAWYDCRQALSKDRRAPVFLNVLDHQFYAACMADVRLISRVVKSVGQITAEHDVFAQVLLLSDAERSAENTHIRVHSHQNDILPTFLLKEVEDFLAVIAYPVIANDLDRGMLMSVCSTMRRCYRIIATSHLCLASFHVVDDWPRSLVLFIKVTPALNGYGRL